jgi:hypothetical protein
MSRTIRNSSIDEDNTFRVQAALARRRSNAAGPHETAKRKQRGGRQGAKVALRRLAVAL